MTKTYTIEQHDPAQGGWTSEGLGESTGWTSLRTAMAAIASLRRQGAEWRAASYRIIKVQEDGTRTVVRWSYRITAVR